MRFREGIVVCPASLVGAEAGLAVRVEGCLNGRLVLRFRVDACGRSVIVRRRCSLRTSVVTLPVRMSVHFCQSRLCTPLPRESLKRDLASDALTRSHSRVIESGQKARACSPQSPSLCRSSSFEPVPHCFRVQYPPTRFRHGRPLASARVVHPEHARLGRLQVLNVSHSCAPCYRRRLRPSEVLIRLSLSLVGRYVISALAGRMPSCRPTRTYS